jgi:hypothetical protein
LEIRTAYGPTITIDEPFSPTPPGASSPTSSLLKPEIDVYPRSAATGTISPDPIKFAPYGDPGESKWPFIVAGLGLLLGWLTFRTFGRR